MDIRKRFGKNIRKARVSREWSQEDLAEATGLDRTYVSGIERGTRNPTLTVVDKFSKALGVDLGTLLAEETEE